MTSTEIDWLDLFRGIIGDLVRFYIPFIVALCIGAVYCIFRWRDNPKGAKFLFLAILLQLLWFPLRYGVPLLLPSPGGWVQNQLQSYFMAVIDLFTLLPSWILIAMAVFARPKHYDGVGPFPIDDDASRKTNELRSWIRKNSER